MGLHSTVRVVEKQPIQVTPINIAETGIEIESEHLGDFGVDLGCAIQIGLDFQQKTIDLSGVVKRRRGSRFGIMFTHPPDSWTTRKADQLHSLVFSLQQMWLKSRIR
ncbi:MAG: hypothetical protein FJ267_10760 [Planctomycetes bacterium]|nr:hypothetical protein [Planctomycetota bacterium]